MAGRQMKVTDSFLGHASYGAISQKALIFRLAAVITFDLS
jgi:hypothetical protein